MLHLTVYCEPKVVKALYIKTTGSLTNFYVGVFPE
jgi:hypothetical protein